MHLFAIKMQSNVTIQWNNVASERIMSILEDCSIMKKCNRGTKRKVNLENWKDYNNKKLRNSGQAYKNGKNKFIKGKTAPEQVSGKTF